MLIFFNEFCKFPVIIQHLDIYQKISFDISNHVMWSATHGEVPQKIIDL